MSQSNFNIPILVLIYNRVDSLWKIAEVLQSISPNNLYISGDGPKSEKENDKEKCDKARDVFENITYAKNVYYNYYEENMGCRKAVFGGISWFFENEDYGIILESDTLPHESFFEFCQCMLTQFENEKKIKLISGTNYLYQNYPSKPGAFLSPFGPIWGWATWKRVWLEYKEDLHTNKPLAIKQYLETYNNDYLFSNWLYDMVKKSQTGELDAWSPILISTMVRTNGLAVIPYRNLVSNIGQIGTHSHIGIRKIILSFIDKLTLTKSLNALRQKTFVHTGSHKNKIEIDQEAFLEMQKNIKNIIYGGPASQFIVKTIMKAKSL